MRILTGIILTFFVSGCNSISVQEQDCTKYKRPSGFCQQFNRGEIGVINE